jgi:hypothetical protein
MLSFGNPFPSNEIVSLIINQYLRSGLLFLYKQAGTYLWMNGKRNNFRYYYESEPRFLESLVI